MTKEVIPYNQIPETLQQALGWRGDLHYTKNAIKLHHGKTTEHYLICGYLLTTIQDNKSWKGDGCCAPTFLSFVENELGLKRSQVQRMMQIWASLKPIIEKHLQLILQIDYSKLALVAPYIMRLNEDEQTELLNGAQHLSVKALEANLAEKNGKVAQDVCEHLGQMEEWYRCPKCSKFFKKEVK
jgi:hypothetical protein